ncbi:MAG: alpha-keto acid decarboxylase family protein [Planctomycetes bacterium]|nr:alpha-keto acid decarboxylase family protein [Planctomycetota bacterium]
MAAASELTLGAYLFGHLRMVGVTTTFGIPGDFVLPLYRAQAEAGMTTVVCAHEPGAAFAADAYARLRPLGVVVVTYGAGALNVVNSVAMSYAEKCPVLVISGAPDLNSRSEFQQVHHMVKSFESSYRVFREITCSQAVLNNLDSAAGEIDRVIDEILAWKRPGYLEIPRDMVARPIARTCLPRRSPPRLPRYDASTVQKASSDVARLLEAAKRPALYVGVWVQRHRLVDQVVKFAEAWSLPVVSSVMGKATFPERHPLYAGVYMGALGDAGAREVVEGSDRLIRVGVIPSDVNAGFGPSAWNPRTLVSIDECSTSVGEIRFLHTPIVEMIRALSAVQPAGDRVVWYRASPARPYRIEKGKKLEVEDVVQVLRMRDLSRYSVIADVGNAWFAGLDLPTQVFLASGFYATMGYGIPAALGAALAQPDRRPLVLVGDGAFRMTGAELGTAQDARVAPIVLLLNNGTYGLLEALDEPRPYYALRPWDYSAFARSMGCQAGRALTVGDLEAEWERAEQSQAPYLIEAVVGSESDAPILGRMRRMVHASPVRS